MTFYVFLKWRFKKRKKSPNISSLLNVYRNFGLKTYRHLSHTVLSCILSVSTLLSKIFDVDDRDLPVPTSSNWVIIGSWLSGYVFYVFWKSKKHDFLRFFLRCGTRFPEHCHELRQLGYLGCHGTMKQYCSSWVDSTESATSRTTLNNVHHKRITDIFCLRMCYTNWQFTYFNNDTTIYKAP